MNRAMLRNIQPSKSDSNETEFQSMMAEIRADMAEQLAQLQEWDANGELAPIPKSLN